MSQVPVILMPGHSLAGRAGRGRPALRQARAVLRTAHVRAQPSQEAKCLSLGNLRMLVPVSEPTASAVVTSTPSMRVRSGTANLLAVADAVAVDHPGVRQRGRQRQAGGLDCVEQLALEDLERAGQAEFRQPVSPVAKSDSRLRRPWCAGYLQRCRPQPPRLAWSRGRVAAVYSGVCHG